MRNANLILVAVASLAVFAASYCIFCFFRFVGGFFVGDKRKRALIKPEDMANDLFGFIGSILPANGE